MLSEPNGRRSDRDTRGANPDQMLTRRPVEPINTHPEQ